MGSLAPSALSYHPPAPGPSRPTPEREQKARSIRLRGRSDLGFLARRGRDDAGRLRRRGRPLRAPEAPHARVPPGEAVAIDQLLPDRHRIAPVAERFNDQLAIGLARTRGRRSTRHRIGGAHRIGRRRVGGHQHRGGRIWRRPLGHASTLPAHRNPGGRQVPTDRLAADTGRLLDLSARPAESPQSLDLVLCGLGQDGAYGRTTIQVVLPSTPQRPRRGGRFSGVHGWPDLGVHRD